MKKGFQILTPRLRLRQFTEQDAEPLFELNADREVMRYTGETPFQDVRAARAFIQRYDHYDTEGFGRWAVTGRRNDEFMGFCGLRRQPDSGEVDVAFRLFRRFWASGYASEAASASLAAGFQDFSLSEIIGQAMRENLPSISILQKMGMKYRDMVEDGGDFWLVYAVNSERFLGDFMHRS